MTNAKKVRFGVTLPQIKRSWSDARAAASEIDSAGYDSAWVCDHLYGVPMPNIPILEAYSLLAAVAAVTSKVSLGALVTPPFFRNPAVLAKQIATIDAIAGSGRAIAGLGSGWFASEFEGYGCDFPDVRTRLAALDDTCTILRRMWTEEQPTYRGAVYRIEDVVCEPRPDERPRILIGGGGEKVLLRLAARHADIWNNLAVNQKDLARKIDALRVHCESEGRSFEEIEISQQCLVVVLPTQEEAEVAVGKAEKVYGGHMGAGLREHGIWGCPDVVIEKIQGYVGKGCTHFVMEMFGRDVREPAALFAQKVLPAFR
ncbi:MAG TPA: LLM class flavin-dependent oxidoreductase [Candidatus Binatia bacterium]|jgi:alkanesulfonate monooxygenase SsuD/methylene tetrahydromethanopterin reductase-like flavin-dependent oxidoreductase (luciferase family)